MRIATTLTTVLIATLFAFQASAQKGAGAIGLRATPDGGGFTAKYFVSQHVALEGQLNAGGILGLEGESFNAVGLIEAHIPLPNPQWRLVFGGGIHAGAWDRRVWYRASDSRYIYDRSEPIFGFDGIGGVEYIFKNIPLGLSADIKPAINVASSVDFFPHNMFGFAARYYFR